jgi:hypothetical protein
MRNGEVKWVQSGTSSDSEDSLEESQRRLDSLRAGAPAAPRLAHRARAVDKVNPAGALTLDSLEYAGQSPAL